MVDWPLDRGYLGEDSALLARTFGLKVVELDDVPNLDVTIDGGGRN